MDKITLDKESQIIKKDLKKKDFYMGITSLISLLNLNKNKYFNRIEIKENILFILPKADSNTYLSTKEIITLHDTLEPFRDIYNIDFSFNHIKISTKRDF